MQRKLGTLSDGLAASFDTGPIRETSQMSPFELMKRLENRPVQEDIGLASLFANVQTRDPKTSIPVKDSKVDYTDTWSKLYQTTGDPEKEKAFRTHVSQLYGKAPKEKEIRQAINTVMPAFSEEVVNRGISKDDLSELMYQTALHESLGGKYTRQMGDGPARSWWQVEPGTAYDNIKNYPQAFGPNFEKATGYDKEYLQGLSQDELGSLLEKDPNFGAAMGTLWYLRKMANR